MRVLTNDPEQQARENLKRNREDQQRKREAAQRIVVGARQARLRDIAEAEEAAEQERREQEAEVQAQREREFEANQRRQAAYCERLRELRSNDARARELLDAAKGELAAAVREMDIDAAAVAAPRVAAGERMVETHERELRAHEEAGGLTRRG